MMITMLNHSFIILNQPLVLLLKNICSLTSFVYYVFRGWVVVSDIMGSIQ